MKAVIILPTYNERENIGEVIKQISKVTSKISGFDFNILVVDDNSPDRTLDIVKKLSLLYKKIVYLSGQKEGLGKALLRGMDYAYEKLKTDFIVQMDADLSHDPNVLIDFFNKIHQGFDFVIGSRYIKEGSIPDNWGLHRKVQSVVGNAIVRFGLGHPEIHDWTGGYRIFNTKYYLNARRDMENYKGYVFQIAFLHKAVIAGTRIKEVPIHFVDRKFGKSKIVSSEYIKDIFKYIINSRIESVRKGYFGKFLIVGTIGFIINTVILELLVRLKFPPWIGSFIGAEFAIVSNFYLNNSWTFKDRKIKNQSVIFKFLQFNTTSAGAMIIQTVTVWLGGYFLGNNFYRYFYILGVFIGLIWNYIMYSRVIWKK
jgi:dolichol-phosphate mannosyltransferase